MAVTFELAIDCGPSSEVAARIEKHFENFTFSLPGTDDVACYIGKRFNVGHWCIGVFPVGLGMAIPNARQDLSERQPEIKTALYHKLSSIGGYRRAIFCQDAFDCVFAFMSPEDLMDYEYPDMIICDEAFPQAHATHQLLPFSDGYSMVVRQLTP